MATTQEILDNAHKLGEMIATHETAKKFQHIVERLQSDIEAQRVMTDYQRIMQKLGEKEAQGRPIEPEEKRQLEKCQTAVARNLLLQQLQMAQMDYLDLMRQVDEAISGQGEIAPPEPAASPLVNPNLAGGKLS